MYTSFTEEMPTVKPVEAQEEVLEPTPKKVISKKENALKRLLDMSKDVENVSSEYFMGYTRGILEVMLDDG